MNLIFLSLLTSLFYWCQGSLLDKLREMQEQGTVIDAKEGTYDYFDTQLWRKTQLQRMVYKPKEHKFVTDKIDVFKFKFSKDDSSLKRGRRSISVFGSDERLRIHPKFVEQYPFSSVVRLENGCTGTLIWHQHVLTAAHCVHNHTHINPPLHKLRIGFLNRDGSFDWVRASQIFVPPPWLKSKSLKYFNHDYAVIKLSQPHQRRWMAFGANNVREDRLIQFAGFPSDKQAFEMWYSICMVSQSHRNVFVNHCDAAPGMSGSGVYVYDKKAVQERKIVGVFSSYVQIEGQGVNHSADIGANVATRLTTNKVKRICKWMNAGTNCNKINNSYTRRRYFLKKNLN